MSRSYMQTKIPDAPYLLTKRSERKDMETGQYEYRVYEVTTQQLGAFVGKKMGGRMIYQTSDGKIFTSAEDAAQHAARCT
jgi:hypothetical protein